MNPTDPAAAWGHFYFHAAVGSDWFCAAAKILGIARGVDAIAPSVDFKFARR